MKSVYNCNEYINNEIINAIIRSNLINEEEISKLRVLNALIKKKNSHKIKFVCKENLNGKPCGRLYPDKNIQSLQNIDRNVRKALVDGLCVELDIVNAFPTILSQIFKNNNIEVAPLICYVNDRNSVTGISKTNINRLIHSGKITDDMTEDEIKFFNLLSPALDKLLSLKKYESYTFLGKARTTKHNPRGTAISFLLQDQERIIMTSIINFLNKVQYETSTIIHDSILIYTNIFNLEFIDEIINTVKEETGYDIKLKFDDMKEYCLDNLILNTVPKTISYIMYDEYKPIFETNHFKLNNPISYCNIDENGTLIVRGKKDFDEVYRNTYVSIYNDEAQKYIKTSISKIWADDENIRTYDKLDFLPIPLDCPDNVYNLFNGFRIDKIDIEPDENIELFFEIIKTVVNFDEISFNYLISYLAQLIQEPAKINEVAIIIQSKEEGCGKNTVIKLIEQIIGDTYIFESDNPKEDLFGKFSRGRVKKLLVNIDESDASKMYENIGRLKNFISSTKVNYEQKGKDPIEIKNFCRYILTTNELNPAMISKDDRRFVAFKCSSKYKNDTTFFNNLYRDINNDAKIKAFTNYLRSVNLNNIILKQDRPKTQLYYDIINLNRDKLDDFLVEIYQNDDIFFKKETIKIVKCRTFYNIFKDLFYESKYSEKRFFIKLYTDFNKGLVITKKEKKDGNYIIINKIELEEYLIEEKYINKYIPEDFEEYNIIEYQEEIYPE